jgi:hypothetical protein
MSLPMCEPLIFDFGRAGRGARGSGQRGLGFRRFPPACGERARRPCRR